MFPSWRIGRPFGINLLIHWSFWLLPLWVVVTFRPGPEQPPLLFHLAFLAVIFVCVVLHELGHALAARAFGIPTNRIVLTPIGGVAQFTQPIRTPWHELVIALAGPLVNVLIALVLAIPYAGVWLLLPALVDTTLGLFVLLLIVFNLFMALFNLLPAFPMDGGRVLRAVLSSLVGPLRATRTAVLVGTIVAIGAGVVGAFYFHTPWPIVIAGFVIWAGNRELASVESEERQRTEALPLVVPLRSTIGWPAPVLPATVFVWDAQHGRWVREDGRA